MLLGKVIGTVWSSTKVSSLEGMKLMVVQAADPHGKLGSTFVIAVDVVQAGVGETVLVTSGSSARQTKQTENRPVDAVIIGIVDRVDVKALPEPAVEKTPALPAGDGRGKGSPSA